MIAWAMEAVVASAMLMALVLLGRAPVRRLFGPQLAYQMWLLPLLRLLMPPLPASWREQAVLPIAQASDAVMVFVQPDLVADASPVTAPVAPLVASVPWEPIVLGAWLLGAAMFFGLHFLRHRRFCRLLLAEARVLDRVGGVRVIETPAAPGPLAFGLAQRFVAFPRDFADRYDADERELALAHELGHHARGDLVANWAALGVLAIHWFNPLAWHAFRAFRCDQELANDARVLAGRSRADRHIYACAILKAAHGGAISAACHLHTITDLKGRLRMLTNTRLSRARHATGAAAILTVVIAGLAVTASGTRAAAALTAKVESATGVQIAAPPTPTAPPAPPAPAPAVRATVPTPPKPPKPPAASTRTARHVVIVKDGKITRYDGDAAAAYIAAHPVPVPPVPPVVARDDCQPATGTSTMTTRDAQGRRVLVICQNRIQAMTEAATRQADLGRRQAEIAVRQAEFATRQAGWAEQQAAYWKRNGLKQAVASIRFARQSIENDRNLSDDQRRHALAGLDEAMKELAQNDQR